MSDVFKDEAEFESELVKMLSENKGWQDGILYYPTEQDLIDNWADILFKNNTEDTRLNGYPLVESEMQQIIGQVNALRTPCELNEWINGKVVSIRRENPDDELNFGSTVSLKIYSRDEIAGGGSTYQIAVQPRFSARSEVFPKRRGDLLLLINGMPVIHIELKSSDVDVSHAVVQIEKYSREGVFSMGVMSLVQIFVAMNPEETVYFANPGRDNLDADGHFNRDYMFHWATESGNLPIEKWSDIADVLLSIPMAHTMVGFYCVADRMDGVLKVMRSYQYYAANSILDSVANINWSFRNQKGGHIWHTTGSGKTLTSFKAAQLVAASRKADKVVFLVDRIELGDQAFEAYVGFASDYETVNDTDDTAELRDLLLSTSRKHVLIVSSIDKMSILASNPEMMTSDQAATINGKRLVLIVDECHRSTFGKMMGYIRNTFPHAVFYGFTGTPIQIENQKKGMTTTDVFGECLHEYTIADGIKDGNVLGFDPIMGRCYEDSKLREEVGKDKAKASSIAEVMADPKKTEVFYHYMNEVPMADEYDKDGGLVQHGIEYYVPTAQWETDDYRNSIVDDVIGNFATTSRNRMFHALFATRSINDAIDYYHRFKGKPHDLRITCLFDPTIDNNDGYAFKEDGLVEILEDYERMYDMPFTISRHAGFKRDVCLRLAHKKKYEHIDCASGETLDILIVVDQMLTGFDSKWINALYLDKVLEYEQVIQAFSRTNRVFDKHHKPHGIVKYFRKPYTMKQNVDAAVKLYVGEKPVQLFVPKLGMNIDDMNNLYRMICNLFKSCGIEHFERVPDEANDRAEFANLFKELNGKYESACIQGFHWDQLTYSEEDGLAHGETATLAFDEDTYLILAQRYKDLFTEGPCGGNGGSSIPYAIDVHLTSIDTGRINAEYIEQRFKRWVKTIQQDVSEEERQSVLDDLHQSFARLSAEDSEIADRLIRDITNGEIKLVEGYTFKDYINIYKANAEAKRVNEIVEAFGVDKTKLLEVMRFACKGSDPNQFGRFDELTETINIADSRAFLEKNTGLVLPDFRVRQKVKKLLRMFVANGKAKLEDMLNQEFD